MSESTIQNRMLALIAVVLVTAALRESYPITMPLAVAVLVIAAVWPIKSWLDRRLLPIFSIVGTSLVLLFLFIGFVAAVYFSAAQIVRAFARNWDQFQAAFQSMNNWVGQWGVSLDWQRSSAPLIDFGEKLVSHAYTIVAYLGFIALLVILGLPQVGALRGKIHDHFKTRKRHEMIDAVDETADKVRRYLGVTTLTSLITGAASVALAFAVGLDLALVWGVLNFLLNYIPVVGNLVGIVPPSLYALIQFQSWTMCLVVFIGFGVLQVVISNFVYPMLQGRSLALSPVAIVLALAFWSWVWGIAGALIAVPLTVTLVIVCEHFAGTRWIAVLLSGSK